MEKNRFKEALIERRKSIHTLELVPGRGSRGKTQDDILRIAERAAQSRLVHAAKILFFGHGNGEFTPFPFNFFLNKLLQK